jgi:uncharacterized protein YjiK
MNLTRIVRGFFIVALWALPARNSFSVEYTYYDSFPLFINEPAGIGYDTLRKTLYIAEKDTRCIFEISRAGLPLGTIFVDVKKITDMAFNPQEDGGFFITQGGKEGILEIDRHGCLRRSLKLPDGLQRETVKAVTTNPERGDLFIVLKGEKDRVLQVAPDGSHNAPLSFKEIDNIDAIHYDPVHRHLLLLCSGKKRLYEATPEGEVVGHFPIETAQAGGITRGEDGLLYILCEKSKRVYVYLPEKD